MSARQPGDGEALIAALQAAQCYPHPAQQVQLEQTHLSWILLAGEYAYKIKKPVRLDFVDFSTLARRRADCLAELELNRRFAPDLYVDVVPIRGSAAKPIVGGAATDGAAIEYAVKLRRFAPQDELCSLLERGAVAAEELERFGYRLAQIHQDSPVCQRAASAERTRTNVMANARELERLCRAQGPEVGELLSWTQQQWRRIAPVAARRCSAGRVRECHGDLHAGNVVRLNGELTAFDCIEFNFELRCIDVMNDVAFLAMDLSARRHRALAYAFLNGWLEAGGDFESVALLRFFAVYRALVRAKVALLRGDRQQTALYLAAARELCAQRKALLVITCGLSGSGKTWFSSRVIGEIGAVRVRSDVERKRLAGLRPDESSRHLPGAGIYSLEINERVYSRLAACARGLLLAGEHAIVDSAALKSAERLAFVSLAHELGVPIRIVHCVAPPEELRERLLRRQRAGRDASEADAAVMERQVGSWQAFTDGERPLVLEVATHDAASVSRALASLRSLTADTQRK